MPKKITLPFWYFPVMAVIVVLCVVMMVCIAVANKQIAKEYKEVYEESNTNQRRSNALEVELANLKKEIDDKEVNLEQSLTDKELYENTLIERDSEINRLNEVVLTTENKVKTLEEQIQNLLRTFEQYKKELGE